MNVVLGVEPLQGERRTFNAPGTLVLSGCYTSLDHQMNLDAMLFPRPRVRNQRFTYVPRYYDPTREENVRQRLRIQSRTKARRKRPINLLIIIVLLVIVLYVFLNL